MPFLQEMVFVVFKFDVVVVEFVGWAKFFSCPPVALEKLDLCPYRV
jgi:hypothetical protein